MVEILYNGKTLATLAAGQTARLACKDKMMASDVLVRVAAIEAPVEPDVPEVELEALPAPVITLDGDTLTILDESGLAERFVVRANGEVVKTMEVTRSLTAPTISLDGVFLTITDESGIAEEFDILVDGEVATTVSAKTLISFAIWWESWAYQAEQGMTWREWIVSEYNTDGWYLREDESGIRYDEYNGMDIDIDAEIIDGRIYDQRHNGGLN